MKYEPDDAQLFVAAQDHRALVTKNRDDFILLHRAWQRWSAGWGVNPAHAGILILAADWPYPDAAHGIHDFVQRRDSVADQLFEWRGQWYNGRAPRSDRVSMRRRTTTLIVGAFQFPLTLHERLPTIDGRLWVPG